MTFSIQQSNLVELEAYRADSAQELNWASPFVLPSWMQVWWESFGAGGELLIRVVKEHDKVIGIAPLMKKGNTALFIGNIDVCDYQDFILVPGKEQVIFSMLLDDMKNNDINMLDLKHVRPDSTVMKSLVNMAKERGYEVSSVREDVSFEMDLPATFEAYLALLNTKQRHEVRRKLRRLNEEGNIVFRFIEKGVELTEALETFFRMFVDSREDKAAFLTGQMKRYFKSLVDTLAGNGLLKLGVLELDTKPIAEILCLEYNNCLYLYNSGYNPEYVGLSAGLLSKVLAIKDCIDRGIKKFDFLKGNEPYKAHIGGQEIPLFRCLISIK